MFGYVVIDKANMYMKDFYEYKAYYCGFCKASGKISNNLLRALTSYDITFLSVLLHGILNVKPTFKYENCILNPLKRKSIQNSDDITNTLVYTNIILTNYKLEDDKLDEKFSFKRLFLSLQLRKYYKLAKEKYPEIDYLVKKGYERQLEVEKTDETNIDMVSNEFGSLLSSLTAEILKDDNSASIHKFMFYIGKYIYICDAIDDIEQDYLKKRYNTLLKNYEFESKSKFLEEKTDYLEKIMLSIYNNIVDAYDDIKIHTGEGVITNIVWYGILKKIKILLRGEEGCQNKIHIKF